MSKGSKTLSRGFSLVLAVALAGGCAALEKQQTKNKEHLLAAAGFDIQPADTPQKLAALQAIKPHQLVRRTRTDGGLQFLYADPAVCRCLFVGDEAAYQRYRALATQQQIAIAEQEAALDASLDTPWAYDPWWAPY